MIEFRTSEKSELWLPFVPGGSIPNAVEWVAERNQFYGWTKYRFAPGVFKTEDGKLARTVHITDDDLRRLQ